MVDVGVPLSIPKKEPMSMNHLGSSQNLGPFLDPYYTTAPNI